eukprot:COSAG01_NODE_637_length_14621_cov_5040.164234_14_plen_143_part_00
MIEISKHFSFEAAHRLAKGYPDKCKNIHGHSFKGELCVACEGLDQYDMGVDFGVLKTFLKKIEDYFDHKLILHDSDERLIALCKEMGWEVVTLPQNPTSEVLAQMIFEQARLVLEAKHPCKVVSVMIAETCTSKCVYKENIS